jgi:hypothetical protein
MSDAREQSDDNAGSARLAGFNRRASKTSDGLSATGKFPLDACASAISEPIRFFPIGMDAPASLSRLSAREG